MKNLLVALLTLTCAACTPAITKVNVPDIAKSDAVTVTDVRPASEKEHKIFSLMITSKQYGVWRIGDAQLSPSPVRLLQHQVYETLGPRTDAPTVTVYHLVIYANMQSQFRHGAVGAAIGGVAGGLIGNAIVNHTGTTQTTPVDQAAFEGLPADEYKRGLYTHEEDPNKASLYIVYIDTLINGKRVFTRTIAPMRKQGDPTSLSDAVQLAIKNQLAKYGSDEVKSSS